MESINPLDALINGYAHAFEPELVSMIWEECHHNVTKTEQSLNEMLPDSDHRA